MGNHRHSNEAQLRYACLSTVWASPPGGPCRHLDDEIHTTVGWQYVKQQYAIEQLFFEPTRRLATNLVVTWHRQQCGVAYGVGLPVGPEIVGPGIM